MARTTEEIIATMDAEQAAQSSLSGLNSPSQTSIYTLWKYIVAQCTNYLEQLFDLKKTEIETILAETGGPSSTAWVRAKAFEFQYDATIPQVMTLVGMIPQYEIIDTAKRIITRCSLSNAAGTVTVLVAKNEPPVKLTAPELASFQGYFTNSGDGTNQAVGIGFAGQSISCYSLDPDLMFMEATITYDGKYANTIQNDTITAIETFISNLGQNPTLRVVELITAIKAVPGFADIFINNLSVRTAVTAWGAGTDVILADTLLLSEIAIAAGYMIGETTATFTLTDKLTFTAI
jgi:hypothetical protein